MKFKPSAKTGKVMLEAALGEEQLPGLAVPEVALKRILVPTDFSEPSQEALRYAISFAKEFKAEILLLHVVESILPPPEMVVAESVSLEAKLHEDARKRLAELRKEVAPKASVKTALRSGSPYREIVQAAKESNVDLIMLGTHGRTGLTHLLIGSTAERVVRHAPCAVMVVRQHQGAAKGIGASAGDASKGENYVNRIKEKRSRESEAVFR